MFFRLLLLSLLVLSGCAGLGYRADELKVTIADIRMTESTLMEQRYLVKLRIQNRSREALDIHGMSFDVDLNGKAFGSGVSNQQVSVPAYDEALVDVKLSSTLFGILRQLQSMKDLESKPFEYKLRGRLDALGSMAGIPFAEQGEIDLRMPTGENLQPL